MALRNHYIAHSNATFDEQPLSMPAIESWMAGFSHQSRHCMWVACIGPEVVGFSSSRPYRDHPAFSRTVETAVYVKPGCTSTGLGSALYAALFDSLASLGLHRAVAGIALPNEASVALHVKFGFTSVGVFSEYACKNGQYVSSLWMERAFETCDRSTRVPYPALSSCPR